MNTPHVDVALNVFGKPCQTALTLASLLRHSADHIRRIYLTIERERPVYDTVSPLFLNSLSEKIQIFIPDYWLKIDAVDIARLREKAYRHSVRYQYAWETSTAPYLLILHNDVYFHKDVIPDMIKEMGSAIAVGRIGQCWNCPAAREPVVRTLGINNGEPCRRERYEGFTLSFHDLQQMYQYSMRRGEHCRPFAPKWSQEIRESPWPLPECRVNEVCCLINLPLGKKTTVPFGKARPFGAYVSAGSHNMDLGVAWFRDVHRQGCRAQNFDTSDYLTHFIGHARLFDEKEYHKAEARAARILNAEFPDFANKCREAAPGLLE